MRAVHRDPDAAAHDDTVDQRDIRLGIALDVHIERIFVAPERQHLLLAPCAPKFIERPNVAAGGKCPLALRPDDHARDRRIALPCLKLARERAHHLARHRIERLGPIERDDAGGPAPFKQDYGRVHEGWLEDGPGTDKLGPELSELSRVIPWNSG